MNKIFKNSLLVLGLIIFALIIFCGFYYWQIYKSINGIEKQTIYIIEGEGVNEVANKLSEKGLIRSALFFKIHLFLSNKHHQITPGTYEFSGDQNAASIIFDIINGNVAEDKVTIIEGWRKEQIAGLLSSYGLSEKDFLKEVTEVKKYKSLFPFLENFKIEKDLEGFLFPDTYQFMKNENAESIVTKMLKSFQQKVWEQYDFKKATKLSSYDYIKLAAIIEREIPNQNDRKKVAGLYLNRIANNMKLDADPTVQYAKETANPPKSYKNYWQEISVSDYQKWSGDYNTYLMFGFPKTPICNPGAKAIESVLNAEENDYLYFFNSPDGKTIFSKTLGEHNKNKNKYLN